MASPMIELRNVSLSFATKPTGAHSSPRRETLLKNISFKIEVGECLVLIGPSGKGKSVLLKLMAGLIAPTAGEILVDGKDWSAMRGREREAVVRKMGMLFQKNALFDSLTVAENVAFPLREVAKDRSEKEITEVVDFYLNAVGIAHARDLFPDEISGGMQKRLGIARALALRPQTVFYDDPTAGLDPITSRKIVQLIIQLRREMNTTVVAVTNDMNRADQMADHIGMVVDGEFIMCGTPNEIKKSTDARVQQFIHGNLSGPLTESP